MLYNNKTLKFLNTFYIEKKAKDILVVNTVKCLKNLRNKLLNNFSNILILGDGSNILLLEDYQGVVLLNRIRGIKVKENKNNWLIHVGSGESWHNLVKFCINKNIYGLENLAFIPGRVGSAAVQNIGAYGLEFSKLCNYVDVFNLKNNDIFRMSSKECQFDYRDSFFKKQLSYNYVIIAVGLKLNKNWNPNLNHVDLLYLKSNVLNVRQLYNIIHNLRINKLPNPLLMGNVGSFFKNPTVDSLKMSKLSNNFPNISNFFINSKKNKISAGWLIDFCGLKNYRIGGASVYNKNALILVNINNNASSKDFINLAKHIRYKVASIFDIWLEPEVNFINALGKIDYRLVLKT